MFMRNINNNKWSSIAIHKLLPVYRVIIIVVSALDSR